MLNDIENLGYLAKHKTADAEYERMEEYHDEGDWVFIGFELIRLVDESP